MYLTPAIRKCVEREALSLVEGGRAQWGDEDYVRLNVTAQRQSDCDGIWEANVLLWSPLATTSAEPLWPALGSTVWVKTTRYGYVGLRVVVGVYQDSRQCYSVVLYVLLDFFGTVLLATQTSSLFRDTHDLLETSRVRARALRPDAPGGVVADWLAEHGEEPLAERLKVELARQQANGIAAAFG